MKYIRRKDDVIFSIDAEIEDIDIKEYKQVGDSIDEVCDYIRFKTNDGESHYTYLNLHKYTIEDIVNIFDNIVLDSVRYCIETDKGLIYVAKLNEKGGVELIWD